MENNINPARAISSGDFTKRKTFLWVVGLVLASLSLLVSTAHAEICVRAGATGANNGTDWTNAYNSLPSSLVRGETYFVASGAYGSYTFANTPGTGVINVRKATVTDHGTNIGWSDGYATGQAVWTGWTFSMSYLTIDGQTGGGPGSWESGHGIAVRNLAPHLINSGSAASLSNITLRHVELDGTSTALADRDQVYLLVPTTDLTMQFMYIHDVGCDTFQLRGDFTRFTLEYSEIARNNQGAACHGDVFEYDSGSASGWVHRYNYFKDTEGTYLWGSHESGTFSGAEIYGNIISGGHFMNGMLAGLSGGGTITGLKFYNNTLANVGGYNAGFLYLERGSNNVIYNNIWYNSPATMQGTHDYNWFYGSRSQSEAHIQNGSSDPFVNSSSGDFRLRNPTKTGISLSPPYDYDMLGNNRGVSGSWDRGALEFTTSGRLPMPPSKIFYSP